jgi:hypothetical protein
MLFQNEAEALAWYEREERIVNKAFIDAIPWSQVKDYELDAALLPVLVYMRDVERLTEVYYDELVRTPTAKDPWVKAFLERWRTEEPVHGDLLNRFLMEAGYPTTDKWYDAVRKKIPLSYRITQKIEPLITNAVGKHFSAVHMTWGAVQEFSTLTGYHQLVRKGAHPVLTQILSGIMREEARHAFFYWSVARIKLTNSPFRQKLTRYLIDKFWAPVGQGPKSVVDTNFVIATLFGGEEGVRIMDQRVSSQLERLPGMAGLKTVTERVAQISQSAFGAS